MALDGSFRRSFYLTLVLACACLGYAEMPILPEVGLLAIPTLALIVTAYCLEGRWTMSVRAANLMAAVIAAGLGMWAAHRLLNPPPGPAENSRVFLFIVLLGSGLVVLMVAKLFRPKRIIDLWVFYLIVLVAVALSCALESDFLFGLVLLAGLVCGIWSLGLFYFRSGEEMCAGGQPEPGARKPRLPGMFQSLGRTVLVALAAVLLYLVTPRAANTQWDGLALAMPQLQTGGTDPVIDLNRVGTIKRDKAVAFEVNAEDARGNPKLDLDSGQRWRSMALTRYDQGRWIRTTPEGYGVNEPLQALPPLGPSEYVLTFTFTGKPPRRLILAEPVKVLNKDEQQLAVVFGSVRDRPVVPVALHLDSECALLARQPACSYRQVVDPGCQGLPLVKGNGADPRSKDPPELRAWTLTLLDRLAEQGQIHSEDLPPSDSKQWPPQSQARVARALEAYLASSGEYTYTLDLVRRDATLDPTLDFLWNTRQGHCERFATALALMLRSVGMPARLVAGFRGCEHIGEGRYLVRQSDAHAWVEVLLSRRGEKGKSERYWQTLDPTPAEGSDRANLWWWEQWWRAMQDGGGGVWRSFVLEYSAEQQESAAQELWGRLTERLRQWRQTFTAEDGWRWAEYGLGATTGLALLFFVRRWRRRKRRTEPEAQPTPQVSFYQQLLAVLARRRLMPDRGQTPREFAETVRQSLAADSGSAAVADIPGQVTVLYYRVRYAGAALSPTEEEGIRRQIEQLETGLPANVAGG